MYTVKFLNVYFSKLSSSVQYMEVQTNVVLSFSIGQSLLRSIKYFSFTCYIDLCHRDMDLSKFRTSDLSTSQTHKAFRLILYTPPIFF